MVTGAPMVSVSEIVPIVLTGCGVFGVFGMGIIVNFVVSTGVGILMSGYPKECGTNGCTLLTFILARMCRYM